MAKEDEFELYEEEYDDEIDKETLKKQLKSNPEFMKKLKAMITFDTNKRDFRFHSTSSECAESIQQKGFFMRDRDNFLGTARSMTEECKYLYEWYTQQEWNGEIDDTTAEYIMDRLLDYEWQGCRTIVLIDQPKIDGNDIDIIQQSGKGMTTLTNAQVVKNAGYVKPQFIVGYIDKENADVILNPLYYNYEQMKSQMQDGTRLPTQNEVNYEEWEKSQKEERLEFAKNIIAMYEKIETDDQYAYRIENEDIDMHNVSQINNHTMISDLIKIGIQSEPPELTPESVGEFTHENIIAMARYLKAAQNLTINGGTNFLEQFCNTDVIQRTLFDMSRSSAMEQFIAQSEVADTKTTRAPSKGETDRAKANEYLDTCKNAEEIVSSYGQQMASADKEKGLKIKGSQNLIQSGKVALMKVIARQQGMVPGDVETRGKNCVCDLNEKTNSLNPQLTLDQEFSPEDIVFTLTPRSIKKDTIAGGIRISEINQKIKELKDRILVSIRGTVINVDEKETTQDR